MRTFLTKRHHQIAVIVVLTAFIICHFLINFYNRTELDTVAVSSVYIAFSYVLFALLLALKFFQRPPMKAAQTLSKIPLLKTALTLIIASCLLTTLDNISHHRLLYNSASALAYAVLMFYVISFVAHKMPLAKEGIEVRQRQFYLLYAGFLLLLFLLSTVMDQSDPYGPHFQLRIVFWLLFFHQILNWLIQLWKLNQQLNNERTNTELMLLKSQINPHFFFNTLNNLYGLAREKSDRTPDLILRLADMMRYTIYQGQRDSVSLQEEIAHLKNFVELQQLRFQKQVQVTFSIEVPQITQHELQLPPLLFINLLENAYKHGVEKLVESAFVKIDLHTNQQRLIFSVVNNFDPEEADEMLGIGLANLRKRLELHYPKQHRLQITHTDNSFSAILTINLTDQIAKEL